MMANESGDYDQDLEDRILKIVYKTRREKRSRPSFQSIHTKLNQGGKAVNIDDLKVFIAHLVAYLKIRVVPIRNPST